MLKKFPKMAFLFVGCEFYILKLSNVQDPTQKQNVKINSN